MLLTATPVSSLELIDATLFARFERLIFDAKPVTTTTSNWVAEFSNVIDTFPPEVTSSDCVSYPVYEISSVAGNEFIVIVKLPSRSVTVPFVVPFSNTDAPISALPSLSETFPVTEPCAMAAAVVPRNITSERVNF